MVSTRIVRIDDTSRLRGNSAWALARCGVTSLVIKLEPNSLEYSIFPSVDHGSSTLRLEMTQSVAKMQRLDHRELEQCIPHIWRPNREAFNSVDIRIGRDPRKSMRCYVLQLGAFLPEKAVRVVDEQILRALSRLGGGQHWENTLVRMEIPLSAQVQFENNLRAARAAVPDASVDCNIHATVRQLPQKPGGNLTRELFDPARRCRDFDNLYGPAPEDRETIADWMEELRPYSDDLHDRSSHFANDQPCARASGDRRLRQSPHDRESFSDAPLDGGYDRHSEGRTATTRETGREGAKASMGTRIGGAAERVGDPRDFVDAATTLKDDCKAYKRGYDWYQNFGALGLGAAVATRPSAYSGLAPWGSASDTGAGKVKNLIQSRRRGGKGTSSECGENAEHTSMSPFDIGGMSPLSGGSLLPAFDDIVPGPNQRGLTTEVTRVRTTKWGPEGVDEISTERGARSGPRGRRSISPEGRSDHMPAIGLGSGFRSLRRPKQTYESSGSSGRFDWTSADDRDFRSRKDGYDTDYSTAETISQGAPAHQKSERFKATDIRSGAEIPVTVETITYKVDAPKKSKTKSRSQSFRDKPSPSPFDLASSAPVSGLGRRQPQTHYEDDTRSEFGATTSTHSDKRTSSSGAGKSEWLERGGATTGQSIVRETHKDSHVSGTRSAFEDKWKKLMSSMSTTPKILTHSNWGAPISAGLDLRTALSDKWKDLASRATQGTSTVTETHKHTQWGTPVAANTSTRGALSEKWGDHDSFSSAGGTSTVKETHKHSQWGTPVAANTSTRGALSEKWGDHDSFSSAGGTSTVKETHKHSQWEGPATRAMFSRDLLADERPSGASSVKGSGFHAAERSAPKSTEPVRRNSPLPERGSSSGAVEGPAIRKVDGDGLTKPPERFFIPPPSISPGRVTKTQSIKRDGDA